MVPAPVAAPASVSAPPPFLVPAVTPTPFCFYSCSSSCSSSYSCFCSCSHLGSSSSSFSCSYSCPCSCPCSCSSCSCSSSSHYAQASASLQDPQGKAWKEVEKGPLCFSRPLLPEQPLRVHNRSGRSRCSFRVQPWHPGQTGSRSRPWSGVSGSVSGSSSPEGLSSCTRAPAGYPKRPESLQIQALCRAPSTG